MQIKVFWRLFFAFWVLTACHPSRKVETPVASASQPTGNPAVQDAGARSPQDGGKDGGQLPAEGQKAAHVRTDDFLVNLLGRYPQYFSKILTQRDSFRVQIIYTRIDRNKDNQPSFRNYYFHVDPDEYFYPASTVKLPVALLALQKLNELRLPGLDKNSSMITGQAYSGQTAVYNDPSAADGRPSIAQYIKKILLVSDNDAFNRLYEFVGQESINAHLHKMGYTDAAILHRLEISLTPEENRHTNPISFYDTLGRTLYQQPMQANTGPYPDRKDYLGNAYYNSHGVLTGGPMDFSRKNRIRLEDLHQVLKAVLFPRSVPETQRFNLRDEDYAFLYQYLSEFPGEAVYPSYDTTTYWDAYGKLLYWGAAQGSLPKRQIRIFNKEGDAYGFLTDISYFTDPDKGIEFMLSATIYCNSDGILNDGQYDYDSVGLPFMKNLGRVIYDYERQRPKTRIPDLSEWKLNYQ
jgi:beta-lactamase class A